jgi:hypothetical protein
VSALALNRLLGRFFYAAQRSYDVSAGNGCQRTEPCGAVKTGVCLRSGTRRPPCLNRSSSDKIRIGKSLATQVKGIEMKIAFIIFAAIAMMTSATAGINNETSCDNSGYRMDQRCVGQ